MIIDKTYFINLDKRVDRLEEFMERAELTNLYNFNNIFRFSAIDAKQIGKNIYEFDPFENRLINNYPKTRTGEYKGELGCFLSHYQLLKRVAYDNELLDIGIVCILEDDCHFNQDFYNRLYNLQKPPDMDFMYLGGRFTPDFIPPFLLNKKGNGDIFLKYKNTLLLKGFNFDRTTTGYLVTKKGALKLLTLIQNYIMTTKEYIAIDRLYEQFRTMIDAYDLFPHTLYSPADYKSDIQNDH